MPARVPMSRKLRLAYFAHSIRSDWNNGNAHFLRGLLREVGKLGAEVLIFEPQNGWSYSNLREEPAGEQSLTEFHQAYPDLRITCYEAEAAENRQFWKAALQDVDVVIVHEWNEPSLAATLLALRKQLGYRLLFHDTHHRASSSPDQIRAFGIPEFDGVIAFGEALSSIYRDHFGITNVWTLHEAADTSWFYPHERQKTHDVVWIGNWGDEERTREIDRFLLAPAAQLRAASFLVYGVRYPAAAQQALARSDIEYGGYLPNLSAPEVYAQCRMTMHIPRQQYSAAMQGIPTIRVFEALACGIPLISAPWEDTEHLFEPGDFITARSEAEMIRAIEHLRTDGKAAKLQAEQGLATVRARHTCRHRAEQLLNLCEEVMS